MKKLMIMMMAIVAVASANAAAIAWNTGNVNGLPSASTTWLGQQVHFFIVAESFDISEEGAFVTALKETGSIPMAGLTAETFAGGVTPTLVVSGPGIVNSPSSGQTDFAAGTYYGIAVIFDSTGDYFAVSKASTAVTAAPGSMAFGGHANFRVYEIIPEPATGLLALAGIGLLIAQKHKRA